MICRLILLAVFLCLIIAINEPHALVVCDPLDSRSKTISTDADWDDINSASFDDFCVNPGDYSARGLITLTADGTAGTPRRILYYDPAFPTDTTHPVNMTAAKRAIIKWLKLDDADHWVIERITVDGADDSGLVDNAAVIFRGASNDNTFNEVLVQRSWREGIGIRGNNANDNTIQGSVIRDSTDRGGDLIGITIATANQNQTISGTTIKNNEIFDNHQCVQMIIVDGFNDGSTFPDTLIENNDCYVTTAKYTDCAGNLDTGGDCMVGESGIVIKADGTSSSPIHVFKNRIWGTRQTDAVFGAPGGFGECIIVQGAAKYVLIEQNTLWDCSRSLNYYGGTMSLTSFVDNVVADSNGVRSNTGQSSLTLQGDTVEFYRNTIINSANHWFAHGTTNLDVRCNIIIGPGTVTNSPATGLQADYNFYYNATQIAEPGTNDITEGTIAAANHNDLCFQHKLITNPSEKCITNGQITQNSPHINFCDLDLGAVVDRGIDDRDWSTSTWPNIEAASATKVAGFISEWLGPTIVSILTGFLYPIYRGGMHMMKLPIVQRLLQPNYIMNLIGALTGFYLTAMLILGWLRRVGKWAAWHTLDKILPSAKTVHRDNVVAFDRSKRKVA